MHFHRIFLLSPIASAQYPSVAVMNSSMQFYDVVRARRSVRNFRASPVEPEKLERIFQAVQLAPSACNLQPYRFLVVRSGSLRERLGSVLQAWVFTAPVLVVALGHRLTAWHRDGQSIHPIDVAIAVEHLVLAATAEGLGTCWICAFDRTALVHALDLDSTWDPVAVVPIGYPDDPNPQPAHKPIGELFQEI